MLEPLLEMYREWCRSRGVVPISERRMQWRLTVASEYRLSPGKW